MRQPPAYRAVGPTIQRAAMAALAAALAVLLAAFPAPASAQSARQPAAPPAATPPTPAAPPAAAPADQIPEAVQEQRRVILRFLTTSDFPPFNVIDDEGNLSGLNVDLARAICIELGRACEVEARPWSELLGALDRRETDAVIAGHAVTAENAQRADFTDRYFFMVARFAAKRGSGLTATPEGLDDRRVGVARGTSHEAYLKAFFPDSRLLAFDTPELAREALAAGAVDVIFDDGLSLMFWAGGTLSSGCCELLAGSFHDARFFGPGLGIAVARGDRQMKAILNEGLARVRESGRLDELMDRYLPARLY